MRYRTRLYIFFGTISFFCFGLVPLRLFQLQVLKKGHYDDLVEGRRTRQDQIDAPRGKILDRNGLVLTTDAAAYDLQIHFRELKDEALLIEELARITAVPEHEIAYQLEVVREEVITARVNEARREQARGIRLSGWKYKIAENVPLRAELIESLSADLPTGFTLEREKRRKWLFFIQDVGRYSLWLDFSRARGPEDDPSRIAVHNNDGLPRSLAARLNLESEQIAIKMNDARQILHQKILARTGPQALISNVPFETMIRLAGSSHELPGIDIGTRSVRLYPQGKLLAQILGTTGKPRERQLRKWLKDSEDVWVRRWARSGVRPTSNAFFYVSLNRELAKLGLTAEDVVGRSGLEFVFEPSLRGQRGRRRVERDFRNRVQDVLHEDESSAGKTLRLTIDARLQRILEEEFKRENGDPITAGAAIFMDVNSGEILASGSFPNFDPNDLVPPVSQEVVDRLYRSKTQPTINRAYSSHYPLGSIFKIVSSICLLEEGFIQPGSTINCQGALHPNNRHRVRCWARGGHQDITVQQALQQSCNVFYYKSADKCGIQPMLKWGAAFGFGARPGTELGPFESRGILPTPEWKQHRVNESWYPGDTRNLSIGQGYLTVSPLQVVRFMSAIANGGLLHTPRLIREVMNEDFKRVTFEESFVSRESVRIPMSSSTIQTIRRGLFDVVNTRAGTASKAFKETSIPFHLSGKTSTAQSGRPEGNVGWFAGYYPSEAPAIAFAIVCEGLKVARAPGEEEEHGGDIAAPIVRRILERYGLNVPQSVTAGVDSPSHPTAD